MAGKGRRGRGDGNTRGLWAHSKDHSWAGERQRQRDGDGETRESIPRRRQADRQAGGNQAQKEMGSGRPQRTATQPLHPARLSSYLAQPWGRGASIQGSEEGAAASEPPRSRRPSPRPQRLTQRGRGIAPAPGGGAGIQSIPGEGRGGDQEEPENREPRSGASGVRRRLRDKTGLRIHWLRGPASRGQEVVQAEDPKESGAGGGVHRNPQGPEARESRIRGAGAEIQPESSGRGRDLVDPEGGREWEVRGVRGRREWSLEPRGGGQHCS